MSTASDLHRWLLGNHVAVVNLHSRDWTLAQEAVGLRRGVTQEKCLARMVETGLLRHVRRGMYVVVDPAREAPPAAVASGAFAHMDHYVTTDAALAVHRLLNQPVLMITVIVPRTRPASFRFGATLVRASEIRRDYTSLVIVVPGSPRSSSRSRRHWIAAARQRTHRRRGRAQRPRTLPRRSVPRTPPQGAHRRCSRSTG